MRKIAKACCFALLTLLVGVGACGSDPLTEDNNCGCEPGEPTERSTVELEPWGEFAGTRVSEFNVNEPFSDDMPHSFGLSTARKDGEETFWLEVYLTETWPLVGSYSLDGAPHDSSFQNDIQATIDGDHYVATSGAVHIDEVTKDSVSGRLEATMRNIDSGTSLELEGSFETEWRVKCMIVVNGQENVRTEDHDKETEFCQSYTKDELLD